MTSQIFQEKQFFDLKKENPCFIAVNPVLKDLFSVVNRVASSQSPVLITGDKGTGKQSYAFQIFLSGVRKEKKFLIVKCWHFPDLIEFNTSLYENCIVFFNDISFLSSKGQENLLFFLKEINEKKINIKVIASASVNLENLVLKNAFNQELFNRLNVLSFRIPALKDRKEDIIPLAKFFLVQSCNNYGKNIKDFSTEAVKSLEDYYWPGNVSELKCVVERACILENLNTIGSENLFIENSFEKDLSKTLDKNLNENLTDKSLKNALESFKRSYIIKILKENNWNQTKAGKILNIQRTYVAKLMTDLKIRDEIKEV